MVMHTCNNEFETEGKQKLSEIKKLLIQHILTMQHKRSALKAFYLILIFWGGLVYAMNINLRLKNTKVQCFEKLLSEKLNLHLSSGF